MVNHWQPMTDFLHLFHLHPISLSFGEPRMPVRHWQAALLALVVLCGVGGCGGNYKFNDNTYRPLGDPQAVNRGK